MNQRQRAFCEAYLLSGNATEAANKSRVQPQKRPQHWATVVDLC